MCHKQVEILPSLPLRVCKTLEGITMLTDDETTLGSMVYRFCHIAREECGNPHEDWLEEFEKVETEVADACASPAEKQRRKGGAPLKYATDSLAIVVPARL